MNNLNFLYFISTALTLIIFIFYLILGRNKLRLENKKNIFNYLPIIAVLGLIVTVLFLTRFYENQLKSEKEKFNNLQNDKILNDSILMSQKGRLNTIDSLKKLNLELYQVLNKIENQENVIGKNEDFKNAVNSKIKNTKIDIGQIEAYNEILDKSVMKGWKGLTTSGNSSNFVFRCPTDLTSEYIDLRLVFIDETLIDKVAFMLIQILQKKNEKEYEQKFEQAYKTRNGVNAFKVRNFLKEPNIVLQIGYVLKSDTTKDYPWFEKISCNSK
jgi:hypothetical protein